MKSRSETNISNRPVLSSVKNLWSVNLHALKSSVFVPIRFSRSEGTFGHVLRHSLLTFRGEGKEEKKEKKAFHLHVISLPTWLDHLYESYSNRFRFPLVKSPDLCNHRRGILWFLYENARNKSTFSWYNNLCLMPILFFGCNSRWE